jgi:hypothetical protein
MFVDGRRRGSDYHPQLCLCTSNPDVAKVMADEILAVLDEFPDVDCISLWPNDGTGMCECDACREMDQLPEGTVHDYLPGTEVAYRRSYRDPNKTVRYTRFVNDVARLVGATRPDVELSALYYHDIDPPPEGVTLEPNVQPCLAHYWRCWRHPLDHPDCENAYFNRITEEWAELYPGRVVIYDYLMGMSCYVSLPWPIVPVMHSDWKRYQQMGIAGATIQSQACHFTVYGPTYSAFARMGWDIDASTSDLALPYFEDLYGESAAPVVEMVEILEERFRSDESDPENVEHVDPTYRKEFPHCLNPTPDTVARLLDDDTIARMDRCLAEAQTQARGDRVRTNVAKLGAVLAYWKLAYGFHQALGEARRLARRKSSQTAHALETCIGLCEGVMSYLEHLSHRDGVARDLVSREMALRIYWPNQYKALCERRKSPLAGGREATTKWP